MSSNFLETILQATSDNVNNPLYCLHGLSLDDLLSVCHESALASPSIAITDALSDYKKYGSILLAIEPRVLLKGKLKTNNMDQVSQIFSRDAFTIRAPEETMILNREAAKGLKHELSTVSDVYNHQSDRIGLDGDRVTWRKSYQNMKASEAAKLLFLKDRGVELTIPFITETKVENSLLKTGIDMYGSEGFAEVIDKLKSMKFSDSDFAKLRAANDKYSESVGASGRSFVIKRAERIKTISDEELYDKINHISNQLTKALSSEPAVDKIAYSKSINNEIDKHLEDYILWIDKKLSGICDVTVYAYSGKVFDTLSEAIGFMRENSGKGVEESMTYGSSDLRGMKAERYISLDEVMSNAHNIDSTCITEGETELDTSYQRFSDMLLPIRYGGQETSRKILKDVSNSICLNKTVNWERLYKKAQLSEIDVNIEDFKIVGAGLRQAYHNIPDKVDYFEAVEYRDVAFVKDNIKAVIVPEKLVEAVGVVFKRYNIDLEVTPYNPEIKNDQVSKIPKSAELGTHVESLKLEAERRKANRIKIS